MSKKLRVKISEILVKAGYSSYKVLKLINYPKPQSVLVRAESDQEVIIKLLLDKEESISIIEGKPCDLSGEIKAWSGTSSLETTIDKPGKWYFSRSNAFVKFSDGTDLSFFYGQAGNENTAKYTLNRASIPAPMGWTIPCFAEPKYPILS